MLPERSWITLIASRPMSHRSSDNQIWGYGMFCCEVCRRTYNELTNRRNWAKTLSMKCDLALPIQSNKVIDPSSIAIILPEG